MILLDTGVALVVYGTPILAFILTITVSLIEAIYLNQYIKRFRTIFKTTLIVNTISTIIGFIIIIGFNIFNIFSLLSAITGLTFKLGDGLRGFFGRLFLLLLFYLMTIAIEIPLFNKLLKEKKLNIKREILIANFLSYLLIALLFFLIH